VTDALAHRPATLADYLAILRRRKWIIVVLSLVAAASAYAVSQAESPVYRASAQILVNRSSVVSAVTNVTDPAIGDPTRFLATEASIARSPELAARVASAAKVPGVTGGDVLGASSVTPSSSADLLNVSVSWPNPGDAVRLANAYATEFTQYKTELDTNRISQALSSLKVRIASLKAAGATTSPSYATLIQDQSQLETIGTLLANNTTVLQPATDAGKVHPRPLHTGILGGLLGAVLGLGLAFLVEALDRRVRSEEQLEDVLQLPLIGRVPRPPRNLRDVNGLVMLAEPASVQAESFRKLKTSIEFLNLEREARTIMVTSALPREGKSTTIANLAVAFARSGRRVALVDLDLRRPFLHSFFHTRVGRGVTDVVAGGESLASALRPVPIPLAGSFSTQRSTNGSGPAHRSDEPSARADGMSLLHLLPAGTIPTTGADALVDFLEDPRLATVLAELADQFELVLVDTPPLLAVGDAMALTPSVDALVLVLHAGVERPILRELARQLHNSRAPALGFVLTGVAESEGYGYGYGSYSYDAGAKTERGASRV
jgi:Mrp family chromosome partitioning ATPase/capsular polysaccharide biosynthesis protein